jgi:hypothetical protein
MNRFRLLKENDLLTTIQSHCQHDSEKYRKLLRKYPFIHYQQTDFHKLIQCFSNVIETISDKSLVISIGESPSKMIAIMEQFKEWKQKKIEVFYLPVSKTVLHMNIPTFYGEMESFEEERNWAEFFIPKIRQHLNAPYLDSYIDFLKKRGIFYEFVEKLGKTKNVYFIDFLMYGNSFTSFFIYLWIPLLIKLDINMDQYELHSIFLIDPSNSHHRLAASLEFLSDSFFHDYHVYYLEDFLSKKYAQSFADFFMDNSVRCIQQVRAPYYEFPKELPQENEYMPLLILFLMMMFLSPNFIWNKIEWMKK